MLEAIEPDGNLDGKEVSNFGTIQLIRDKGIATWVAAGCTVSPPIVSLCL